MGIPFSVACDSCGVQLTVKKVELIGKRVKCPKCTAPILVSAPAEPTAPDPMAAVETLAAAQDVPQLPPTIDEHAVPQPSVPQPNPSPTPTAPVVGSAAAQPVTTAASPVVIREQKSSSSVVARRKKKSSKLPIYIGAGATVFVLGVTALMFLMAGDSKPAPSNREQAQAPQPIQELAVIEPALAEARPVDTPATPSEPVESALTDALSPETPDPATPRATNDLTSEPPISTAGETAPNADEPAEPNSVASPVGEAAKEMRRQEAAPASPTEEPSQPADSTTDSEAVVSKAAPAKSVSPEATTEDATIEDLGLSVRGTSLVLESTVKQEQELSKRLAAIVRQRTSLYKSGQALTAVQQRARLTTETISKLKQQNVQLNARLARVTDVVTNNQLVGAIQVNAGQIDLGMEAKGKIDEEVRSARSDVNKLRAAYVQEVLDMRELANGVSDGYKKLGADPRAKPAIERLETKTGKKYMVASSFRRSLKKLESFENAVLSEKIPLRRQGGTLYVSVVVDGKHSHEMVLDSGASIISLPENMARQCGIQVKASDPTIVLQLADGSEIEGKMVRLASVRVGKFEVKDVECAVLGPEAIRAEPLLGMSFLEHFKIEIDSQESVLSMVQVDTAK